MKSVFAVSYLQWTLLLLAVGLLVFGLPGVAKASSHDLSAPTNLHLTAKDEQIRVGWNEPDTLVGGPVTRYVVQWKSAGAGDEDWQGVSLVNTVHTAYVISWLDNGTEYEVRVRAANALGLGPWTEATATPSTGDQPPVEPPGKRNFNECFHKDCNEPKDQNLDLDGTDKPVSTSPVSSAPAQAQEPPGKKDFKTCVGGRSCNDPNSPYYWKVNQNSWE